MATELDNKAAAAALNANASPDFLRQNRAPAKDLGTTRYVDMHGRDEFDHNIMSHRTQLEMLHTQITNLDQTIELEQQKLRESKAALEASYHARARLLHLREAMLHFVLELERGDQ